MNRHPFRWGSAVFGLAFAAVVATWVVLELDLLDVDTAGVSVAATLIVLGVLGIAGTIVASRRPTIPEPAVSQHDDEPEEQTVDQPDRHHAGATMDDESVTAGTEEVPHEQAASKER